MVVGCNHSYLLEVGSRIPKHTHIYSEQLNILLTHRFAPYEPQSPKVMEQLNMPPHAYLYGDSNIPNKIIHLYSRQGFLELGVYVGSALQAIEVEAGYSPTNIKPSYSAVLNNLQVTTSAVVCNRYHRYARHVNF